MKYLTYVLRNAKRNPVRSLLTIASMAVSTSLMMILLSFFQINDEVSSTVVVYNRVITMNSQGFAGMVPVARVREIASMSEVLAASPFQWYGGKYGEETMPFAQFAIDPDTFFTIYDELTVPADQLKAFHEDKAGCVIGRKLADERGFKIGDPLPLKGDIFPIDLKLNVRGIYDGPRNRDLRMCVFHYGYFDDALKQSSQGSTSGNAGAIIIKCKNADGMAALCRKIDDEYRSSDNPTRTLTEEAFGKMFADMMGDLNYVMYGIAGAVLVSLVLVAGNAMAMAMRERTTEVAVLKAIGYGSQLVLFLVLAEAMIVAGVGGLLGTYGCKALFDAVDFSKFTGGFLPFFYVPWSTTLVGVVVSVLVGFLSGIVPALLAARQSVVNGLRQVV
jgi:putative ABC transport system permease protein